MTLEDDIRALADEWEARTVSLVAIRADTPADHVWTRCAKQLRALLAVLPSPDTAERVLRRFRLVRDVDVSGVSGTGAVVEGVEFSDGTVALRWVVGEHRSTSLWLTVEAAVAIHGHDGATRLEWLDLTPTPAFPDTTETERFECCGNVVDNGHSQDCFRYVPPAPAADTTEGGGRRGCPECAGSSEYCQPTCTPVPVPVGSPQDEDVALTDLLGRLLAFDDLHCTDECAHWFLNCPCEGFDQHVEHMQTDLLASGLVVTRAAAERMQAEAVEGYEWGVTIDDQPVRSLHEEGARRVAANPDDSGRPRRLMRRALGPWVEVPQDAAAARARTEGSDRG